MDKQYNILLIENDDAHAELIRSGFEGYTEYNLIHAKTIDASEKTLQDQCIDLIIADITTPNCDTAFFNRHQLTGKYPVLIITTYGNEQKAVELMREGAIDYIIKAPEALTNLSGNMQFMLREWQHVNKKRQAELALQKSEKRFKKYIEYSPTAVFIFNNKGEIEFFNAQAVNLIQIPRKELGKQNFFHLLRPNSRDELHNRLNNLEIGEILTNYETQTMSTGNTSVHIIADIVRIEKTEYMAYCKNISERIEYENQLKKAKQKAEESDNLKTAFLANLSHEIRTPMNAILGFTQLLDEEEEITMELKKDFIQIINKNTQQLLNIINDIITMSQLDAGQVKTQNEAFDLNGVIVELHNNYQVAKNELGKSRIDIIIDEVMQTDDFEIVSDRDKLYQILSNLIDNALKFTMEGQIQFGYEVQKSNLVFYVKDTGIGMNGNDQKIIFDRFRQIDNSITRQYGGTGLGLTITKELISLLDGIVWLDSEVDSGTNFYFSIPYTAVKEQTQPISKASTSDKYDWSDKKLLLVEDDISNQHYFDELLRKTNIKRLVAANGVEAVDLFKEHQDIDIVLMDMQLPVMNGFKATELIKQERNNIPVIAQTAYAMNDDREKCLAVGCDDYITKPINKRNLLSLIDKYLTKNNEVKS